MERKEAIEVIRKNWPGSSFTMLREALCTLIPELTESEDDKIRRYIIDYFKGNKEELSEGFKWNGITVEEVIAWLEKQGEQKPVEKLLFDDRVQYASVEAGIKAHAETYSFNIDSLLFGQLNKEQQKLWRKEIEQAVISGGEAGVELANDRRYEQKPEWSEEDKICLMRAISACEQAADEYEHSQEYIDAIDWLRALKDRILPQPKQEWSEEDENMRNHLLGYLNGFPATESAKHQMFDWFKALRPQKPCTFIATEEELAKAKKDAFNDALDKIEYHSGEPEFDDGWSAALKFVRQKQWKPSEEQMDNLSRASTGVIYRTSLLMELYRDLNRLME